MSYPVRAVTSMICAVACLLAIAVYGITHEGTKTDQLVAWGLVLLGFVFLGLFGYNLARWDDAAALRRCDARSHVNDRCTRTDEHDDCSHTAKGYTWQGRYTILDDVEREHDSER